jgi:hypothetical protein
VNIASFASYGTASYPTLHTAIHPTLDIVKTPVSRPDCDYSDRNEPPPSTSTESVAVSIYSSGLVPDLELHSSAMGSIWTLANIKELDFAATSTLLAIKAKQRSISDLQHADDQSSDESESGEDGEDPDAATTKTVSELATFPLDALKDRFLDRLAEVFSREKSSAQCRGRKDSSHVAATAWIEADVRSGAPLTVLVAKNEGLDELDRNVLSKLQRWLRAVSVTGQDRTAQADKLWIGDGGLVDYSRNRLLYHISEVMDKKVTELAKSSTDFAVQIIHLQSLCRAVNSGSTIQQLSSIVDTAYPLRDALKRIPVQPGHRKAVRSINMLTRLRAAYECFKSVALTFDAVSTLELKPVDPAKDVQIKSTQFCVSLKRLCWEMQLPGSFLENKAARKYTKPSCLHVHAEMQILVSLGKDSSWHTRAHPYIGVSKRLCFICSRILRNFSAISMQGIRRPSFRARQCHGKVYPLWTLPQCEDMPCVAKLALTTAIFDTHYNMRSILQAGPVTRSAVAESSAGVTVAGSISTELAMVKEQYSARSQDSKSDETVTSSEVPIRLERKIKTVNVGRLPADGSSPEMVAIDFHKFPDEDYHKMNEGVGNLAPDFHSYWGKHQFERRFHKWTFNDQPSEDSNGEYRVYYNGDFELSEETKNKSVKRFLEGEEINDTRLFWHGDIFLVRYSEHPETYKYDVHDVPATSIYGPALRAIFRHMWNEKTLEVELETERVLGGHQEKFDADKAIIYQRMLVALTHHFSAELIELPPLTLLIQEPCGAGCVESPIT